LGEQTGRAAVLLGEVVAQNLPALDGFQIQQILQSLGEGQQLVLLLLLEQRAQLDVGGALGLELEHPGLQFGGHVHQLLAYRFLGRLIVDSRDHLPQALPVGAADRITGDYIQTSVTSELQVLTSRSSPPQALFSLSLNN